MLKTGHLHREIAKIKKKILALGAEVEEIVVLSLRGLTNFNMALMDSIIEKDNHIDLQEVDLEEDCLKILALNQPVAIDLRFLISVLKMNNDLERIGDLAVNIVHKTKILSRFVDIKRPNDLMRMAEKSQVMLRLSLDALVNLDPETAYTICGMDDEVDAFENALNTLFQNRMKQEPDHIKGYISLLDITYHLERIADHATNLAEDVIYMVSGQIVRHNLLKSQEQR